MKISEAIQKANSLRDNLLTDKQKVDWLRDLDGQIADFMGIAPHGFRRYRPKNEFVVIDPEKDTTGRRLHRCKGKWPFTNTWPEEDAKLLMSYPHEDVYPLYLVAMIDYYNQESALYENDLAVYNSAMSAARAWWRRNHRPPRNSNVKVW